MGAAYYAMEEYDSAQAHLERSLEIDPNYATGWGQLGWVFYVQKDYDKAQPELRKSRRPGEGPEPQRRRTATRSAGST